MIDNQVIWWRMRESFASTCSVNHPQDHPKRPNLQEFFYETEFLRWFFFRKMSGIVTVWNVPPGRSLENFQANFGSKFDQLFLPLKKSKSVNFVEIPLFSCHYQDIAWICSKCNVTHNLIFMSKFMNKVFEISIRACHFLILQTPHTQPRISVIHFG